MQWKVSNAADLTEGECACVRACEKMRMGAGAKLFQLILLID